MGVSALRVIVSVCSEQWLQLCRSTYAFGRGPTAPDRRGLPILQESVGTPNSVATVVSTDLRLWPRADCARSEGPPDPRKNPLVLQIR